MAGAERWQKWFNNFARDHLRIRLERQRSELRARHSEGPEEYLSNRPPLSPLPRFRVRVGTAAIENTTHRRPHRRTNRPPPGRPAHEWDVYLAPKVFEVMWDEWVSEIEAIRRITETLGQFDGWDNPAHPSYDACRAARKAPANVSINRLNASASTLVPLSPLSSSRTPTTAGPLRRRRLDAVHMK